MGEELGFHSNVNEPKDLGVRDAGEPRGSPLRWPRLVRPLLYALGIVILSFGLTAIVERTWLEGGGMPTLHRLHEFKMIFTSLLVALVVGWTIIRSSPTFLHSSPVEVEWARRDRLTQGERTRIYAEWFIAMRWIAVLIAGLLVFVSVKVVELLPSQVWWPLVLTVATLAVCNLFYTFFIRWETGGPVVLLVQGYVDLGILTVLLHFSGGLENPLSSVMIFHVIIGGILLSRGQCYGIAATASLLFAFLIWAEWAGFWQHYTLSVFPHVEQEGEVLRAAQQPLFAFSRPVLQSAILFLTAYFVTTLAERMRFNERRLEAMADRALADHQLLERALATTGAGLRVLNGDLQSYWASEQWNRWFVSAAGGNASGFMLDEADSPAHRTLQDGQVRVTELLLGAQEELPASSKVETSQRAFQVTTAPLLDVSGKISQVVELAQDITQQKRTQAQMIRAGKLAAVGELAGQVAHEVNNPVAIISNKASLLLSGHASGMTPKVIQELGKIRDLAKRVARIAQGLLSYCRPSVATRVPLDLRVPIRKSLVLVEEHARREGVRIEDHLPERMPVIQANPGELEQVFLNLYLNALDAMPKGGWLTVSALPGPVSLPDGKPAVAVVVEDTGCGIPGEIREEVFEPFFTTKQEGRGTGLGLSICLGLIRSHGGEIKIDSKLWQGTRVTVKLPMVVPDGKEAKPNG